MTAAGGINNTPIGNTTVSTGNFSTLGTTGDASIGGNLGITGTLNATTLKQGGAAVGSMAFQAANAAAITGGSISGLSSLGVTGTATIIGAGSFGSFASPSYSVALGSRLDVSTAYSASDMLGAGVQGYFQNAFNSLGNAGVVGLSSFNAQAGIGVVYDSTEVGTLVFGTSNGGSQVVQGMSLASGNLNVAGTLITGGGETVGGNLTVDGVMGATAINGTPIGSGSASTGNFTTVGTTGDASIGGVIQASGFNTPSAPGVSCAAGTLNLATAIVTNGVVTHC